MPYEISWYVEKRVIFERLLGDIDLATATEVANLTATYLKQGTSPVHLIIDVSGMTSFPTNITKVNSITASFLKEPNLGWVILIGANTLAHFVTQVIGQVVKFSVTTRPTVAEAIEFLREYDSTLHIDQIPSLTT